MSVSSAFCCLTAGIQLQYQTFGLYDSYIKSRIAEPFLEKRYKCQTPENNFMLSSEALSSTSLYHFDGLVRAKTAGYKSAAELYTNISCARHLHKIKTPVMFLIAKDDPITKFQQVPLDDLKRNPNFMVGLTEAGGHCEFFYSEGQRKYGRFAPKLMSSYFNLVGKHQ